MAPEGVAAMPFTDTGIDPGRVGGALAECRSKFRPPADGPDEVPPERRAFAANLIRLRSASGLTQDQLSARSGVSQSHISGLEKGAWEPRLSTILGLAKAFGVAPAALVRGWDGA